MQNDSALELSGDSPSLIETQTAEANICSLDDLFLLNSEDLGQYLAKQTAGILLRVEALRPYYLELWKRFDELKDGETICGCATRKEYCKEILHRSMRSIQYVLYGRSEPKQLPPPSVPVPSNCPVCKEPQPSKSAWGRHVRASHPDMADGILGEQRAPQNSCTAEVPVVAQEQRAAERSPRTKQELKPIDYKPKSFRLATAPKEPKPTEVFYVIQRKSDSQLLSYLAGNAVQFEEASILELSSVRRFPKPVEYSCVYYVPDGKRKEVELDRSKWRWVKVSIQTESLD